MVAYLEKTDGNAEFHEIIDFLARSSIHNALTLKSVPVPLDHFPVNALTSKVFSFMVKKGKHFSGKVTPLFSIKNVVQSTEDEGEQSERPSEHTYTSPPSPNVTLQIDALSLTHHLDLHLLLIFLIPFQRVLVGIMEVTDQAKQIKQLKVQIKKLKKKAKPVIAHHKAWVKSVSLKQRLAGKKSLKKQWMQKESVSKQGRKPAKAEPSVHKDPLFDELADDTLDYMDTENAQDVGKTRNVVYEKKESAKDAVSTEDVVSTDKEKVSTDRSKVSTDRSRVSTNKEEVSTDRPDEGTDDQTEGRSATPTTQTPTPTTFGDDETIAQVLLNMSQAKAPLPKIDPKDKGKKKIEEEDESDTESEGIPEAEKKFKQLARDEEMARKAQEDWEAEEEVKKLAEEEAIKAALSNEYDFIQARIKVDRLLALRLQEEEREQFTVEERAKFLHDTIAAQRRFLAEQRAIAIRNRPPTRTQLRNQMMTYLKHVGNKKHLDLKNKTFKEIQALYEKVKRFDESFTAVGSTEDERKIKEMNKGAKDLEHKRLKKKVAKETPKKEDTAKVPAKVDVTDKCIKKRKRGHMKMLARKRKRPQSDVDSDDEYSKCLKIVTFEGTIDSEIMERKSVIARLNQVSLTRWSRILSFYRANGTFTGIFNYPIWVLHIFERQDLFHLYKLVIKQYLEVTMEGIELILWGDLKIMMESSKEENNQKLEDGIVIHMLVERRYPLSKDLMQRMLDFGLEVEIESTVALDLIRFISNRL
ncbi:hypothetical protein Tco_1108454 [Tanacetum coccineum]